MYTLNVAESKEENDDQTVYVAAAGVGQIEEKVNEVLQGLALESESEIKMVDVEEVGMEQSKDEGKQCQTVGDVKITDEVTDDLYETLNQVIIELEKSNLKDECKSFRCHCDMGIKLICSELPPYRQSYRTSSELSLFVSTTTFSKPFDSVAKNKI